MWLNLNGKKYFHPFLYLAGIFFGILFLGGCTTFNPATGRSEFIIISTAEELGMGRDVHKSIAKQYNFSEDQAINDRIQTIGERLAQVSDRQDYQYHFYVIEKEDLNAFTTPGGNIYIFTGLIEKMENDGQIAAVLS